MPDCRPWFARAGLLLPVLLLAGCAGARPSYAPLPRTFDYPGLPDPPRLQLLMQIGESIDVAGAPSGFETAILGAESTANEFRIRKPFGVCSQNGRIWVCDVMDKCIEVFDLRLGLAWREAPTGPGALQLPNSITITEDGVLFVTDRGAGYVKAYRADDFTYLRSYGAPDQMLPTDCVVVGDRLYVTELKDHSVKVFDVASGDFLFDFTADTDPAGHLHYPVAIARAPDGTLLVTSMMTFTVQRFTPEGEYVSHFGSAGTGLGQLARPKGLAVDPDGVIYLVDAAFQNVQLFDAEYQLLMFFGGATGDLDAMGLPAQVWVDATSNDVFEPLLAPGRKLAYVVLVTNQTSDAKLCVYGFLEQGPAPAADTGGGP